MYKFPIWPCVIFVVICLLIASASGWVTRIHIPGWFAALNKPSWNPPSWVFGPVWTVLYILIGIVGGILWQNRAEHPTAFNIYLVQLLLNFAWSFIFFSGQQIGWALVDILALWASIAVTIGYAFTVSAAAGWLLVPYFLWVTFASVLNFTLWRLN